MTALLECIPNFSEGRREKVITALIESVGAVEGVRIFDHSSDSDHNRTVITFGGLPEAVLNAAFAAVAVAAGNINLEEHAGQHPRLGATDVVPLVPLRGLSMSDCVALAHQLAKRIGTELGLPVYLYEHAAQRPERRNLANIRRGGYENLRETIQTPERAPDYGPAKIGTAGAVIVGARDPLIAYNVFLNTGDVRIAQQIAQAIRGSSGGLTGVKALGMLVDGHAQVSMNLVDYRSTPLPRVMELIRAEATRYGVQVIHSELIGLIPQEALAQAAAWYLQLHDYHPGMILENHLCEDFDV